MPAYRLGGTSALAVTTSGTQTITGPKTFLAGSATSIPVVVQGVTGQTGNLTEWRDSSGTAGTVVNKFGEVVSRFSAAFGTATFDATLGTLSTTARTAATVALVARGVASQTANLQEWQNSAGTSQTVVSAGGSLSVMGSVGLYRDTEANAQGAQARIFITSTTNTGLRIDAPAAHTSYYINTVNSAGQTLMHVNNMGRMTAPNVSAINSPGEVGWGSAQILVESSNDTNIAPADSRRKAKISFHIPAWTAPQIGADARFGDHVQIYSTAGDSHGHLITAAHRFAQMGNPGHVTGYGTLWVNSSGQLRFTNQNGEYYISG